MKIPNPTGLFKVGRAFVQANRPELLFGTSIVTTVSAVVMAARGGYKSGYTVAEEDIKRLATGQDRLDMKEIASLTWLNYLPAAGVTAGALGATTGLHLVHVKEKKQLAAAALIAIDQVRTEGEALKKELLESVGVAKSEDEKELERVSKKSGIAKIVHSDGEVEEMYLVRDERTGRDIWSNRTRIESAVIDINNTLQMEGSVEVNTFYGYAGFNSVPDGEEYGWGGGDRVELYWKTEVRDDGRPVRVFRFLSEPKKEDERSYG